METITCKECGSEYKVREITLMARDIDSYDCDVCGKTLHRWNGASCFAFELTKKVQEPNEKSA